MKISLNWLKEYVDLKSISTKEIIDKLTMSGLEVEDFIDQTEIYKDFIVGQVTSKAKHSNADKLSVSEIAKEIQDLSERARNGQLKIEDFKDGTFSITSFGSIGGQFAVPVINYPQVGILGIGRIMKKPVVKADNLGIGHILPISLTVDHRVIDGGDASRFVNTIMDYLADPVTLIFE